MYEGRPAWILYGRQAPNAAPLGALGDTWRMLLDKGTGLILYVEYDSGSATVGSAGFTRLTVDGKGAGGAGAPPAFRIPDTARRVSGPKFQATVGRQNG